MDGENNGSKPYEQMDDSEGFHPIFGNTQLFMAVFPSGSQEMGRAPPQKAVVLLLQVGLPS